MTTSLFPSEVVTRLRRSVLLSGVLFISFFAGICGDDDDDDNGGTGPSADCIDEIDFTDAPPGVDENDVEPIAVGDSESGSLSTSDPDDGGYYIDIFALAAESDGDVSVTVNPSGFDAVVVLLTSSGDEIGFADDADDPDATETLTMDLNEGCYIILVTSYDAGETGSYTIAVD